MLLQEEVLLGEEGVLLQGGKWDGQGRGQQVVGRGPGWWWAWWAGIPGWVLYAVQWVLWPGQVKGMVPYQWWAWWAGLQAGIQ